MSKTKLIFFSLLAVIGVSVIAAASASAHQWLKNGSALTKTEEVLSSGGQFELTDTSVTITCETVTDTGLVLMGTMDEATSIHFLGCKTNKAGCDVSSEGAQLGLILVSNVLTELVLAKTTGGQTVLADQFKGKGTKENFVGLLFTSLTAGACNPLPELDGIKGHISAVIENSTEELNFPATNEVVGNTLELGSTASKLIGRDKQMLTNGGTLTAE